MTNYRGLSNAYGAGREVNLLDNGDYVDMRTGQVLGRRAPKNGTGGGGWHGGGGGGGGGGGSGGGGSSPGAAFNGAPQINLFDAGANYTAFHQPAGQNYLTMYYIEEYNAIRGDMYFNDLSGGIDAQVRMLREGGFTNELAQSFLQSYSRTLVLPPLITADATSTNEIGTLEAMSATYLNDGGTARWLVAAGDTANKCLFSLGPLTAQTYTPSSNIVSLTTTKIVTNTERVIVGRAGAAAQVLTGFNGTPTTSGTMHANTTQLWGAIVSPLNSTTQGASTILMYCNDGLYSLSTATSAIGDAPTAVLTNWPGGGYALGITTLADEGVARAYWVHPLNDSSTSMLDAMDPGRVVSTDLEGTDPKTVNTGLPFVRHAMLWRGGIVVTDGKTVNFINQGILDLGWNRERKWEIPATPVAKGLGTIGHFAVVEERLFAHVSYIVSDVNDYAYPVWEEYDPEENVWKFVSKATTQDIATAADLFPSSSAFTGKNPVYQPYNTKIDYGVFYWYEKVGGGLSAATYQWDSMSLLPSDINPNWQQADSTWLSYSFDTGGTGDFATTPEYLFFGLPMVVSDIWFGGRLNGEDSQVDIYVGRQTASAMAFDDDPATFIEDADWRRRWWVNPALALPGEAPMADRMQLKIQITQGTSGSNVTKTSPNALPFRVGFYIFLDGNYTSPKTMEPKRYWGPKEL